MPTRPRTICRECGHSWDGVLCQCGHRQRTHGWQSDKERGTRQERGYTDAWLRLRAEKLKRQPWCEACAARGVATVARHIHHLAYGPGGSKIVAMDQLQALCVQCHREAEAEKQRR